LHGEFILNIYRLCLLELTFCIYLSHCLHNAIYINYFAFLDYDTHKANLSRCEVSTSSQNPPAPGVLRSRLPFGCISKIYVSFSSASICIGQANIQQNFARCTKEHRQLSYLRSTLLPCFASRCRLLNRLSDLYVFSCLSICRLANTN